MPRNITITFADGSSHVYQNAPDDLTPEAVTARARQEFGKEVQHLDGGRPERQEPGLLEKGYDLVKSVGADAVRGVGKAVGGAVDSLAGSNYPILGPAAAMAKGALRGSGDLPATGFTGAVEQQLPTPKDSSPGRQYLRAGIEGGAAGLLGGGTPTNMLVGGAGAGVGGEAGARLLGEGPMQRLAGGLLGGMAGGLAAARINRVARPQVTDVAREALEGIGDADLAKAKAFQELMAKNNVQVDLAQALEGIGKSTSNLTTVRNFLANSKEGTKVQQLLRDQPGELGTAAGVMVNKLPGNNYGMQQSANNLQDAATGVLTTARKQRTDLWTSTMEKSRQQMDEAAAAELAAAQARKAKLAPFLEAAEAEAYGARGPVPSGQAQVAQLQGPVAQARGQVNSAVRSGVAVSVVPAEAVSGTQQMLREAAAQYPNTAQGQALERLAGKFVKADGTPIQDPAQLNQILKEAAAKLKSVDLASSGLDAQSAKWIGAHIQDVREELGKTFKPIRDANAAYKAFTEEVIDPLKKGPVGGIATPKGAQPDRAAATAKLTALFDKGTDPQANVSEIRVLGRELAKQDPGAFRDALKAYVSSRVQGALSPVLSAGAAESPKAAARIDAALFTDRLQFQGLKEGVEISALTAGQSPVTAVRGLVTLAQMVKAASSRPSSTSGMSPEQLSRMSGKNAAADVLRIFGFLPFEKAARRLEDASGSATLRTFDDLLTSPDGAATLVKLGRVAPTSQAAQAIVSAFVGSQPGMATAEEKLSGQ